MPSVGPDSNALQNGDGRAGGAGIAGRGETPTQDFRPPMQIPASNDPLWDEGIASFLLGEYEARGEPLSIDDLQRFAIDNATRVGDILETLFLMAIYGEWRYTDAGGEALTLDQAALDELYSKGRLGEDDLAAFSGVWTPAAGSDHIK